MVAGLSIGAWPAAVVAGVLDFGDALRLVRLRGQLMADAYPSGYGMAAIVGLDEPEVGALVAQVHSAASPAYVANLNAERQIVVAGSDAALARVMALAQARGEALDLGIDEGGSIAVPAVRDVAVGPDCVLAGGSARRVE